VAGDVMGGNRLVGRALLNYVQERLPSTRSRNALNRFVTMALPKPLPLLSTAQPLLEELEQAGNVYLPELVPLESLLSLRRALEQQICYDPWQSESDDFQLAEAPESANNARIRGVSKNPAAIAIANHSLVLSVVSNYLGCLPTIDDIVAWWSLPGRSAPKEEQFFHRDRDAVKFVKLFVYLSDVDEAEGAHVYISGSQRTDALLERRRRYEDDEVFAAFSQSDAKVMAGPRGTAFLEDTFGLHKGAVPATQPRLLLQVRYTSSPSNWAERGRVEVRSNAVSAYDAYINRFID
jgi:hypothetical protein